MANNGGQPILHSASFPGPLPVRPLSHGMQGLSSAQASRLLAAITNDSALKDYPGAYDLGELEQPFRFNLGGGPTLPEKNSASFPRVSLNIVPNETFRFDSTEKSPLQVASPTPADTRSLSHTVLPKGIHASFETPPSLRIDSRREPYIDSRREPYIDSRREPYIDSRREPYMADNSPHTETSSDNEPDRKTELMVSDSMQNGSPRMIKGGDAMLAKNGDSKAQRRLAQNREAARKSRLRKKAYVQQLENSRMKLNQLEQELQRARQQGVYIGGGSFSGDQNHSLGVNNMSSAIHTPGALAFDMDYSRWLEEHNRQISDLRGAIQNHTGDNELRLLVDSAIGHYDDIFRLKSIAAKADVFHLLSGMWKSPAERCFMWMGGHRPSELLKIILPQVEPLTEQQVLGICNLQQSSQQAEDALSQGMDSLQQSLAETLSTASVGAAGNVANYMGQMAIAMGKLGTFESFVRQADLLRQQTLQQLHRILTIRQSARALLVNNDYFSRLRALSSLWLARPRE